MNGIWHPGSVNMDTKQDEQPNIVETLVTLLMWLAFLVSTSKQSTKKLCGYMNGCHKQKGILKAQEESLWSSTKRTISTSFWLFIIGVWCLIVVHKFSLNKIKICKKPAVLRLPVRAYFSSGQKCIRFRPILGSGWRSISPGRTWMTISAVALTTARFRCPPKHRAARSLTAMCRWA